MSMTSRIARKYLSKKSNYQYQTLRDAADVTGDRRYGKGVAEIWYCRYRDFAMGPDVALRKGLALPTIETLESTHVYVGVVGSTNSKEIFHMMQGEIWSPNGEARSMIARLGLKHTSMSVGDIILIRGMMFMVDMQGFYRLGK